jgi:hypothetical protein
MRKSWGRTPENTFSHRMTHLPALPAGREQAGKNTEQGVLEKTKTMNHRKQWNNAETALEQTLVCARTPTRALGSLV